MDVEQLRNLALSLPHSTEDMKWGDHLVFSVLTKMFCIVDLSATPVAASLKVSRDDFDYYCSMGTFRPAPYLARYDWICVNDVSDLSMKEWNELITNSYALVWDKISRRKRLML